MKKIPKKTPLKNLWLGDKLRPKIAWTIVGSGVLFFFFVFALAATAQQNLVNIKPTIPAGNSSIMQAAKITPAIKPAKDSQASEDLVLVKFKSSALNKNQKDMADRHKLTFKGEIKEIGVKIFSVSADDTAEEIAARLNTNEKNNILYAQTEMYYPPSYIPNDPQYANQWHHSKMNNAEAWDIANGSGVTVGIADSGINSTQPDLAEHLVAGWNFYDNNADTSDICGHGTAVAGVEAAVGDNSLQVAGVAYGAKIMPLRVVISSGTYKCWANSSTIANAIIYAADNGVKTINLSFANMCSDYTISNAASYMYEKGGIVVAASGNSGAAIACLDNPQMVLTGATDSNDALASFSSFGPYVDIAAPGVSILTTANSGGTSAVSGTSFSTPNAAGVLALIWSANPTLTASQAQQILFSTATDLGIAGKDDYYGWGRVNSGAAVALANITIGGQDTLPPSIPVSFTAKAADTSHVTLSWSASKDDIGVTGYFIYRDSVILTKTNGTTYTDNTVMAGNIYTYTTEAYDAAGNVSGQSTAATVTVPTFSNLVVITGYSVTNKTATSAKIIYTTNIPSTGYIKYGIKQRIANLTKSATDNLTSTTHSIVLTGLVKQSAYQYQITAENLDQSNQAVSPISSFKTGR